LNNEEAIVGRALKQAFIGTILSGVLVGLTGCMSLAPKVEPTPQPTKHQKVVRTTPQTKVVKYKKVTAKKLIKPTEEAPVTPPVIPAMGGGGNGGSGGGGWGG
jgi:hypothetical protein